MTDYVKALKDVVEDLKPLQDEVGDRKKKLVEDCFEDDDYNAFSEHSELDDEKEPEFARREYYRSIMARVKGVKGEVDRKEEHLFPVSGKINDSLEDLELAVKQLEKASKRIDTLEDIHDDLDDVNYIMWRERMLIDFVLSVRFILDEIIENFRTSGDEEIREHEAFTEGGYKDVIKRNKALVKDREYMDGEMDRDEVDWSIDTENAERGDFNELREEHFEGLKSITFEIEQCRNELDSALLITAKRIGTAIEHLEEAEEYLEKAEASELLENCSETIESLKKLRRSIERETVEPMDDGLRRCETFIQDLIEGNSDDIERILNGGSWLRNGGGMGWDRPEIYKEDEQDDSED